MKRKAVILAGGLGTRLRPFTEVIPKPLLPVGEQSLMEVQIRSLARHGFGTIYVATNYRSDYVEAFFGDGSKFGVELVFSCEEQPLGTCGPLSLLRDELDQPFLLMNGDVLTKLDFGAMFAFGEEQDSGLTLGTKIISTPFRFGNVKVDENNYVIDVDEKPEFHLEILAGVYFFRPETLSIVPDSEYFGMDHLIKKMRAADKKISRYLIKEYWLDIGQVEDYSQAREDFAKHF